MKKTFRIPADGAARLEMTAADLQLMLQGVDPSKVDRSSATSARLSPDPFTKLHFLIFSETIRPAQSSQRHEQEAMPLDAPLPDDLSACQVMIRQLLEMLKDTRHELAGVQHRLDLLLKRVYGPKAERFDPNQPTLFDGGPPEPAPTPPDEPEAGPRPKKKGDGRRPLPDHLRRRRIECDLSDVEKLCPCCHQPRIKIGEEASEQLDYRPASLFIREQVRFKYACPLCLKKPAAAAVAATPGSELPADANAAEAPGVATQEPELTPVPKITESPSTSAELEAPSPGASEPLVTSTPLTSWLPPDSGVNGAMSLIVTAPMPKQPLPKSIAAPGLLAHIIVSKYLDHLPLHRLEGIFSRQGVDISRKTMSDGWRVRRVADALVRVVEGGPASLAGGQHG